MNEIHLVVFEKYRLEDIFHGISLTRIFTVIYFCRFFPYFSYLFIFLLLLYRCPFFQLTRDRIFQQGAAVLVFHSDCSTRNTLLISTALVWNNNDNNNNNKSLLIITFYANIKIFYYTSLVDISRFKIILLQ